MRAVHTKNMHTSSMPGAQGLTSSNPPLSHKTFKRMVQLAMTDKTVGTGSITLSTDQSKSYDIAKDPHCMNNLIDDSEYENTMVYASK